jgi:hypothetical protein
MRALILACVGGLALAASAPAAPFAPNPASIELGVAPPVQPVRDGCGRGWHRNHWRDQWGNWHWDDCIRNGGPDDAWTAGWSHHLQDRRAEPPRWGWGYQ